MSQSTHTVVDCVEQSCHRRTNYTVDHSRAWCVPRLIGDAVSCLVHKVVTAQIKFLVFFAVWCRFVRKLTTVQIRVSTDKRVSYSKFGVV